MVKQTGHPFRVVIENGSFSRPQAPIFRDVSFRVGPGETLCILGPNGCGKTTLVDCLLGIHSLDTGRILLEGTDTRALSPKELARIAAYVPQKHSGHFSFSVMDVLLMGRAPYTPFYDAPGHEEILRAEAVLKDMGLTHLKDRDYTRLSGGETQLVLIMRALVQETPVIIMDEPTAHLDFRHELIVLETIIRLAREKGITLIMATHFPNHAFFLENAGIPVNVAFMGQGRVRVSGTPSQALTRENIQAYFQVKTWVAAQAIPGQTRRKLIIPIQTVEYPDENKKHHNP